MKLLLFILIAGILVYFLLKFCLYLYRPFFLSRTFREIEQMYNRLLTTAENDISSAVEDLKKWDSGDRVLRIFRNREELTECINTAKAQKAYEEEIYRKFLRLRERFIQNPTKLSESIIAYRRYLEVRMKQHQDAMMYASAVIQGISTDEMMAVAKETRIVLEENERKLDKLLNL